MKPPVYDAGWPEDVQALYRHDVQEMWNPSITPHIWNQYRNQLDIYLSLAGTDSRLDILDVGCAQGTLALLLAERGHDVCAVDIRQQFLDYAATRYQKGKVRFVCGNVLEMRFDQSFDLIFANQIVEHLVYPEEFTQRLVERLKPSGRLVMTTPNWNYFKNRLPSYTELGEVEQYADRQFTADGDGHFFAYRDGELKQIFERAGLRDVRVSYFETPFISGHFKVRHLHPVVPRPLLKLLDRATLLTPGLGARVSHQLMAVGTLA